MSFVERHGLWSSEQKEAATRLRKIVERLEMPRADGQELGLGIVRQGGCEGLGEFAERAVDHAAAVGRARLEIDGVELAQLEDVARIDRVGIAQPVLDVGDGEIEWARLTRRLGRGLGRARDACRPVERAWA